MFEKKENNAVPIYPKNGMVHAISFKTVTSLKVSDEMLCDVEYTKKLNSVLEKLQVNGYEIVDIKFQITDKQAGIKPDDTIRTLILYK